LPEGHHNSSFIIHHSKMPCNHALCVFVSWWLKTSGRLKAEGFIVDKSGIKNYNETMTDKHILLEDTEEEVT